MCFLFRARANLWAGREGFDLFSSFYVRCFYKGYKGDADDVELGFLHSPLLVMVRYA